MNFGSSIGNLWVGQACPFVFPVTEPKPVSSNVLAHTGSPFCAGADEMFIAPYAMLFAKALLSLSVRQKRTRLGIGVRVWIEAEKQSGKQDH